MSGLLFTIADHIDLWIADGGSIHIKTREPHGDPAEMDEDEAMELAECLRRLAQVLRE